MEEKEFREFALTDFFDIRTTKGFNKEQLKLADDGEYEFMNYHSHVEYPMEVVSGNRGDHFFRTN